jgi:hypothetical protein
MQAAMILALIEQIIRFGPAAIVQLAKLFEGDSKPTVEEIKALKITKDPEEYFK